MSVVELPLKKGSALERVVATARKMEEHEEFDRWQFADDVREAVDELSEHQNGFGAPEKPTTNTGLYAAIDKVNNQVASAGVVSVGRQSIVAAYTTAKAWPKGERVVGANYWAHFELRAREYDGRRQQILNRLVKQHKSTVSTPQVRLWKSSTKPMDITPRHERLEKKIRAALRSWASPQKFTQLHPDEQNLAEKLLYQLAGEISRGEFK